MAWMWEIDLLTSINALFDISCLTLGVYLFITRFKAYRASVSSTSLNVNTSQIPTYSLWTRKPRLVLLTAIAVTTLWHLIRIMLTVAISLDAYRSGKRERAADTKTGYTPSTEQQPVPVNPLLVPPGLYAVLALPVIITISRLLLIALFAFSKRSSFHSHSSNVTNTYSAPSSPISPKSPVSISPSSPTSKVKQRAQSPTTPTTANANINASSNSASNPISSFITYLPSRIHGPNQNLYLIAFYICMFGAAVFMPFTYNPIWYIDTPRVEFVATLYLAGVLQDAKNVPGLTIKEKRQRGIPTFQNLVLMRWAAIAIMLSGMLHEIGWRAVLDGTVMFILWRVES